MQLAVRTMELVGPPPAAQSGVDGLIELAVRSVDAWTDDGGLMILARHELLLESARHPDLRRQIDAATEHVRALLERRVEQMDVSDAGERAADLIACLDGLALAHVVAAVVGQDALARSVRRVVVGLLD